MASRIPASICIYCSVNDSSALTERQVLCWRLAETIEEKRTCFILFLLLYRLYLLHFGKQPSPFLEAHSCRYFFSRDAAIPEKGGSKTISRIFHGFFCCFCKIGKGDGFEMF